MMRTFGLAMIVLGAAGLGLSLIDWRSMEALRTGDQLVTDAAVDRDIENQDDGGGRQSADSGPASTAVADDPARQELSDEASADDLDPDGMTETALRNVRESVQPTGPTGTGSVAELSPANVRVFETPRKVEETESVLWAEISAASEIVNEGSGHADFLVTLSEPAEHSVVIIFSTVNLSATDQEDYRSQRGTVTFEPGVVSAEIRTPLVDDDIKEDDEQFAIVLNGAPGIVSFKSRRVTATIKDDD